MTITTIIAAITTIALLNMIRSHYIRTMYIPVTYITGAQSVYEMRRQYGASKYHAKRYTFSYLQSLGVSPSHARAILRTL